MSERAAELARATQLNQQAEQLISQRKPVDAERLLRQAIDLDPDSAIAWNNLGRTLNNLQRLDEAEVALRRSVDLDPAMKQAWFNLGHVQRAAGRLDQAELAARQALVLEDGGDTKAIRLLASLRLMQGDAIDAIDLLDTAGQQHPDDCLLILELGDALRAAERFDEAGKAYRNCLELDAGNVDALAGLGTVHHACLELEKSIDCFRQVLGREPGHPVAQTGLALVLELDGEYQLALDHVLAHLEDEDRGWAVSAAGRLLRRLDRGSEAKALLEAADIDAMKPIDRISALTTLGQVREKAGEFGPAFECFAAANECQPSRFDPHGFRVSVDRIISFFTPERLRSLPGSACDSQLPVFIVGMPRSGTSMIEQILGRHSRVVPCGERRFIFRLPRKLSGGDAASRWPEVLTGIGADSLRQLSGEYLDTAAIDSRTCARFTDKLPANFLNLGLIQLLFPRARVVYCRRDPLDSGLSCFQQNFRSEGMDFARSLEHIGVQQQACWRLMDHWMETLSLPIQAVDYEQLVADPETGARTLVEFLGLDWEPACLDFHLSERIVQTASYEQVRQPVYTSSVGRWRPYEPWLGPLRTALAAPWD